MVTSSHLSGQSSLLLSSRSRDLSMSLRSRLNLSRLLRSKSSSLSPIGLKEQTDIDIRDSFCIIQQL